MFARRFSIVCLAAALAGGGLAMLVQDTGRPHYSWSVESARACPFGVNRNCLRLLN